MRYATDIKDVIHAFIQNNYPLSNFDICSSKIKNLEMNLNYYITSFQR